MIRNNSEVTGKAPVKLQVNKFNSTKLIWKIKKVVELSGLPVYNVNLFGIFKSIFFFDAKFVTNHYFEYL
jgi:hypothetical protein